MRGLFKPFFLFFFILIVPVVFANSDYERPGGNNTDFVLGTGFFNSALTSVDTYVISISRVSGVPLISNIDGVVASSDVCSGTATVCSSIFDETNCDNQFGCSWSAGGGGNGTAPVDWVFRTRFDNSYLTTDGESPTIQTGTSFVSISTPAGNSYALLVNDSDVLRYNSSENYNDTEMTFSFWVYILTETNPCDDGNTHDVYDMSGGSNGNIFAQFGTNTFRIRLDGAGGEATASSTDCQSWNVSEWHHILGTWNSSVANVSLFFDGVLVDSDTATPGKLGTPTDTFDVGQDGGSTQADVFLISDFTIYPRVLNYSEILGLNSSDFDGEGGAVCSGTATVCSSFSDSEIACGQQSGCNFSAGEMGVTNLEIAVMDGSDLVIYRDKNLNAITGISTIHGVDPFYLMANLDVDVSKEIIVVSRGTDQVSIFEFDGITISKEINFSLGISGGGYPGYKWFNCRDDGNCLVVGSDYRKIDGVVTSKFTATAFNISGVVDTVVIHSSSAGQTFCSPGIPVMVVADYDEDGSDEFIFSYAWLKAAATDVVKIQYVDVNSSGDIVIEQTITKNFAFDVAGGGDGCDNILATGDAVTQFLSSPLVFDAKLTTSGLETVVAVADDTDEFRMHSFKSDGSSLDSYPIIFLADGKILSNPMRFNSHTDTGRVDFCVLGFEEVDKKIDLLCASEQSSDIPETHEFFFDITGFNNISNDYANWERLAHSGQHSSILEDGNNLDELIISYGVFSLNYLFGDNELDLIFQNPKPNGVVSAIDLEEVDREDLLVMTSGNLWYLDDGFSNQGGQITGYYIDPCIDNTWKVGTQVEVRITVTDPEGDDINASAVLYSDTAFSQSSLWSSGVSGSTKTFLFVANETVGNSILSLFGKDVVNPDEIDQIDVTFTVGSSGIEWGQGCVSEVIIGLGVDVDETVPPAINESVKEDLREMFAPPGLVPNSIAPLIALIFIIIIPIFVAFLLAERGIRDGVVLLYLPLGIAVILWMFFVFIDMLPGWTVIVGILISAAVIGYRVWPQRSGMG